MKAIKFLLFGIIGLVVLAIAGLGAAVMIVDGQFVKTRLERAMKEKNRTLKIEGVPQLKLFPVAGVALGKASLSEPGSDKTFVSLDSAEVAVRVMPLLSGTVALEKLNLAGFKANVVKRKDGRMNFSDLAGGPKADAEEHKRREPPKLKIAGVGVQAAQLSYRDEATGQELTVGDLNLKTGRLDGSEPGEVSISAQLKGKRPDLDVRVQAAGKLRFDLGREEYMVDGFSVQAKGAVDRDQLSAAFSAPKVAVTPAKASGEAITGSILLKGPGRNVDAKLNVSAMEGTSSALSIPRLVLDLNAAMEGNAVKGKVDTALKANLAERVYELPKIVANLAISSPKIPQKSVTLPIQASLRADLGKQNVAAQISTKFDESNIQAKLGASRLAPLAATFDVAVDRLNLDRYLPPERKEAKADERIDLSALKGKTVSGKIAVGALTVKRVKLQNLKADIKLAGGKLDVSPHSANLYGGTLSGALSADANGNRIHVKEAAQNVAVGALLRDAAQKDVLEGRGNVNLDVQTAGGTVAALKKALAGSARVEMKDGAIKGVNLADSARNLKSALGAKQAKPDPSQKTDFSEMSASFKIANGVARNDDLKAASPFLRLGGAGNLDIGNNTIDYLAKATLAATTKGQGGREAGNVAGITIPVKLSGALDNPQWNVDYSGLLGGATGGVGEILKKGAGGVTETVKKGAGGVGDALRGLFKR